MFFICRSEHIKAHKVYIKACDDDWSGTSDRIRFSLFHKNPDKWCDMYTTGIHRGDIKELFLSPSCIDSTFDYNSAWEWKLDGTDGMCVEYFEVCNRESTKCIKRTVEAWRDNCVSDFSTCDGCLNGC